MVIKIFTKSKKGATKLLSTNYVISFQNSHIRACNIWLED